MYRVYNKPDAISRVQSYLQAVGVGVNYIAPSGVYDSATKEAITIFQRSNSLPDNGVVDKKTFDLLYSKYVDSQLKKETDNNTAGLMNFPFLPTESSRGMVHINRLLAGLLVYYGFSHNIRFDSNIFSKETERAVEIMRKIYLLAPSKEIDWQLYRRMISDYNSISEFMKSQ